MIEADASHVVARRDSKTCYCSGPGFDCRTLLGSRRLSLIEQAGLLRSTFLFVLGCARLYSNHGIACALRLGPINSARIPTSTNARV